MSPIASFDVNAREALCNPHQAAIDTKKPAVLVLCGLSVLHRTYPNHELASLCFISQYFDFYCYFCN
ncbi:hypothetical protein ZF07_10465 [Salmonella enterica subsp. enterica]|nr:hypothetical protein [Salmonella enterica subsp. enterica serovar Napoli]EAC0523156.1 hypothetical protein [Salmonella enterica subsp. enterica serovar Zaiman]EAU6662623.1 hypothetical protein [Salmonella enterica]EDW0562647.1 hypothetical protein [Salmonella enterica subsp. enterica]EBV4421572.1 hypothetical protein [Salmonella enterica subsp. enterica serovar Napoli]